MINFLAPFTPSTSYGIVALNLLQELEWMGEEPTAWAIGQPDFDQEQAEQGQILKTALDRQSFYYSNSPSVRLFHQFSLAEFVGIGERIGFPIFELNKFNKREKHHLSRCDRLIVCSQWAKDVVRANLAGNIPIGVVPLGVNTDIFRPQQLDRGDTTVFANISKWEVRKGHDILAEAFRAAFGPNDNVVLRMFPANPFIGEMNQAWANHYKQKLGDQVEFRGRLSTSELVYQMNCADAFVFPSRAEGWSLPTLEALALGKQVIAPFYSGFTEYLTPENALLIHPDKLEVANDNLWFRPENTEGGEWMAFGESQFEQLVAHMREVHRRKMMGESLHNQAGVETAQQFSWTNSARRLVDFVNN